MPKKGEKDKKVVARRTLHYYFQCIKKYKWSVIFVILVTPLVIVVRAVLTSYILADMIDEITEGAEASVLIKLGIELIATYLVGSVIMGWLRIRVVWELEIKSMYDLSVLCFDKVSNQSMSFHSDRFSGSIVSQANKFINNFERLFDTFIFNIVPIVVKIVAVIAVLAPRAPEYTVVFVLIVTLYVLCSALAFKKIAYLNKEWAKAENAQTGQLADSMSNILAVKSYGRESHERHRYANYGRTSLNAGLALMRTQMSRDMCFNIFDLMIISSIVIFMIVMSQNKAIDTATLILIVNYSMNVMGELWNVNSIFKNVNRVFGDASDMTEILDTEESVKDMRGANLLEAKRGKIEFNNITFRHKDAPFSIFENFNLDIKPGERIGLVGMSGSGKTTLTKLLLRFSDVQAGEICVDGQNISKVQQTSLREAIAYVPQETALFHRSISENIAYGKPNATEEEIVRAAKLANAHEFIEKLPQGYGTLVGERGVKLSGGQRQRVAIARAILKDAPILVLDEATSALDSESEALIQDALLKLMKGRTSIVVAHRLSTIASLDKIVVLDNGKIVEQGSHTELLAKNGAYAKLWSRQSGAFMDE